VNTNGLQVTTRPRTSDGTISTEPPTSLVNVTPNTPYGAIMP